jgi:hypothetical protein
MIFFLILYTLIVPELELDAGRVRPQCAYVPRLSSALLRLGDVVRRRVCSFRGLRVIALQACGMHSESTDLKEFGRIATDIKSHDMLG